MELIFAAIIIFLLLLVQIGIIVAFILAIYGTLTTKGVPYVPAPIGAVKTLSGLIELKSTDVFYDLGCGDGKLLFGMEKIYPKTKYVGVEKAPLPVIISWIRSKIKEKKNVSFLYKDFNKINISEASHVFLYLMPNVMNALLPKLKNELRQGTKVITCDFKFKDIEPSEKHQFKAITETHNLYLYEF